MTGPNRVGSLKVAIVHEWLVTLGGSELVLRELLKLFPGAHVFSLIDKMPASDRAFLGVERTRTTTSFLDRIPGVDRRYRALLPLFPLAIRSLDVRGYDLVISNSHAVAKGVRTTGDQLHLCYCLSPMRYAWDLREQYLKASGVDHGTKGLLARAVLGGLRRWDAANSDGVHAFIAISEYIEARINRAYGRSATVIYPPVDTEFFTPSPAGPTQWHADQYYLTASRFVRYKRIDLIASAFRQLPHRRLVVVGDGPDVNKVRAASGPNVTLAGRVDRERLRSLLRGATAFLFAADEDFGIAPVEAQACGTPVIAYRRGGVRETVRGVETTEPTGVYFDEQSGAAIADAIRRFEALEGRISSFACRRNAERFGERRFRSEMTAFVDREWRAFTRSGKRSV
jgi:glycosyltransferase involved in cell wall biosynthesis